MTQQKTFFERIGHIGLCVLLTDILQPEDTRNSSCHQLARWDGIYFASLADVYETKNPEKLLVKGIRHIGGEDYLVPVSTTADLSKTYTVLMTEEQLRYVLPWDVRLEEKDPSSIRSAIRAHVRKLQPVQSVLMEHGHFLDDLRSLPFGEIADASGAFERSSLCLAVDTETPSAPTYAPDAVPLLDLPISAQDVYVLPTAEVLKDICKHGTHHPRVRAFSAKLAPHIALKALEIWIRKLWDNFQEGFVDAIHRLNDQHKRINEFLVAGPCQPVVRVGVQRFRFKRKRNKELSLQVRGAFAIIDTSVALPMQVAV